MKLNQPENLLLTSDKYQRQQFSLGDASVILMLLTQQYNRPIITLTQEYISNARDANREVNSPRPIRITLPTQFRPMLEIRDFGPGITPERMENVFIKIAASTKRDTNAQTGGFGIGAKSAWAYTDKFNVITYVDGICRSYVAHYTTNPSKPNVKEAFLDQLESIETGKKEEPTDEENGTTIQIPVRPKDIDEFRRAAMRSVYFWEPHERPEIYESEDGTQFDKVELGEPKITRQRDRLSVYSDIPEYIRRECGYKLILIDGIPYSMPNRWHDRFESSDENNIKALCDFVNSQFGMKFNTGELYIPPTREGVADTESNKKILDTESERILDQLIAELTAEADDLSKGPEMIDFAQELNKNYKIWNCGKNLAEKLKITKGIYQVQLNGTVVVPGAKFRRYQLNGSYDREQLMSTVTSEIRKGDSFYVDDFDPDLSERSRRMRIKAYMEDNDISRLVCLDIWSDQKREKDGTVAKDSNGDPIPVLDVQSVRKVLRDDFDFARSSSFPTPAKRKKPSKAQTYSKRKVEKGHVLLHYCDWPRQDNGEISCHNYEVKLGKGETTVVYRPLSARPSPGVKDHNYTVRSLAKSVGLDVEFGFLPDGWLDKNKSKWSNLIAYEDFIKTKQFKDSFHEYLYHYALLESYRNARKMTEPGLENTKRWSYSEIDAIKNPKLRKGLKILKRLKEEAQTFHGYPRPPKAWQNQVDISKEEETLKAFIDELREGGNSIIQLSLNGSARDVDNQDLIEYINYVHKKKKRNKKQNNTSQQQAS